MNLKLTESAAQEQLSQDAKQFPKTAPSVQYIDMRFAVFFQFLVNQSQSTSTPEFFVTNSKASLSEQDVTGAAVGDLAGALVGVVVVIVGDSIGVVDGEGEGFMLEVGLLVGEILGSLLGLLVGLSEGSPLGSREG